MSRKFLDDIKTDINTLWADNITGNISPADLRGPIIDSIDSLKQDEGQIASTAPTIGLVLTGTFQDLITTYDIESGDDGSFLKTFFASGQIQSSATPGFSYQCVGRVTVEAANNETIEFSVGINSVPIGFIGALTGNANNDLSVDFSHFERAASANDNFTLMARAADGAATIDIQAILMTLIIWPTNNP